jgi:lincosamide and streptogramin A transport system ATP-binding/permease protein
MSIINISHLSFGYPNSTDEVFHDLNLILDSKYKLGLISRNGKGKTTFLQLLSGSLVGQGTIIHQLVFDYFPLEIPEQQRLVQEILEQDYFTIESWKIERELNLLGLSDALYSQRWETLSLGEQVKLELAILFAQNEHFLLIDEVDVRP